MHYLYYTVGEQAAAVESLRKKMMTNLENARDRVNFLCKHLFAFYIFSLSYLMTISIILYEEAYKLHSWLCVFFMLPLVSTGAHEEKERISHI